MSRLAVLLCLLAAVPAAAGETTMNAEIDYLLERVAASGCVFIRNGSEHDAGAAADHLAMKRRRGRRYYDSADDFVDRIASRSSWTGKPYRIRCGDDEQTAKAWFTGLLEEYRGRLKSADDEQAATQSSSAAASRASSSASISSMTSFILRTMAR